MSELTQKDLETFADSIATLIAAKNAEFIQKLIALQASELHAALEEHNKQLRLIRQSRIDTRATQFMTAILQSAFHKAELEGEKPPLEQIASLLLEAPHTAYLLAERMERRALVSELQAEARLADAKEQAERP